MLGFLRVYGIIQSRVARPTCHYLQVTANRVWLCCIGRHYQEYSWRSNGHPLYMWLQVLRPLLDNHHNLYAIVVHVAEEHVCTFTTDLV